MTRNPLTHLLTHLLATLTAPLLDARHIVPDDTDCWLDTPDDDGEPDETDEDEPLPDDATPEQEVAMAARYATRRATLTGQRTA